MKIFKINVFKKKKVFNLFKLPVARKRVINPEQRRRAFTLIELMVVIAIIGILATIIVVSYINAQAKSRDNKRRADVQAIASAHQVMYQSSGKWYIPGTGYNSLGTGWFNVDFSLNSTYGALSIAHGLEKNNYIDVAPTDPKMTDDINIPPGNFQYMVYPCDGGRRIFAHLEFPTDIEIQDTNSRDTDACPNVSDGNITEMNYAVIVK